MIEMIAGVFGLPIKDKSGKTIRIKGMGPNDGPFSVSPECEAELVKNGIARYVEAPHIEEENMVDDAPIGFDEMPPLPEGVTAIPEYSVDMKATELREIGKLCGLTFKVGMSKQEMVDALDKHIEENMVDDEEFIDADTIDPEDAPTFDPAGAVE